MKTGFWVTLITLIVVILWLNVPEIMTYFFPALTKTDERGQAGDMYGIITSLFTGLTIIGLVYTIILQREDIRIARTALEKQNDELVLNRKELALNRKELKANRAQIQYQRFETTFFNLVKIHNDLIERAGGTKAFQKFFEEFITPRINKTEPNLNKHNLVNIYHQVYSVDSSAWGGKTNYTMAEEKFGQYVRNFQTVVEYILSEKKRQKNLDKYIKLYFSQVSDFERVFLFFHLNLNRKARVSYYEVLRNKLFINTPPVIDSNVYRVLDTEA